jgi:hypothetical protein
VRSVDVAVVEECTAKNARLDTKVIAAEGVLDGDLPDAPREELRIEQQALRINSKKRSDLAFAHAVEVVRNVDFSFQKAEPPRLRRRVDRRHSDERLAGLRDDERFATCGAVDETG